MKSATHKRGEKLESDAHDKSARLDAIKRIVRERTVATQEELGKLLHAEGFKVTQGTLSRDLAQLGALRVPRQGGTVYELGPEPEPVQRLRALGELVLFISDNEALAVVRTQPGAANAVARAVDLARIPECLGSIAGDDTIFLTPVRGVGARRLSNALRGLLGDAEPLVILAKTDAAGERGLLPEVLVFSSSLALDKQLLREDLLGSLAHLTMLSRRKIIPAEAAAQIRGGLIAIWNSAKHGALQLPDEEDVHMAVEASLTASLGETAGLLHTARSRNDQIALDLRLHVREQCALALESIAKLLSLLASRAAASQEILLPSYTHRQRAQPITLAYLLCGYAAMFSRDAETLTYVLEQCGAMPLGVGAIGGTSLPIDRAITAQLLRFSRITGNGLDTVGDRDFALDFAYATARTMLHISRVATDMIDFSTAEFGYVKLDGEIACGSSMMPQKKNPDVFELLRGKSGRAVGNLTGLFVALKGLPGGYNRDQQEDRQALLETGPLLRSSVEMLSLGLSRAQFDGDRTMAALQADYMQATDVAEALAQKGIPFRTAYRLAGQLVRRCQDEKLPLARATLAMAQAIDPRFDHEVLEACDPRQSVLRKRNAGGTGPASVQAQIAALQLRAREVSTQAAIVPRIDELFESVREAPLS